MLEPTFEVTAPSSLPQRAGSDLLEGLDHEGRRLFLLPFEADRLVDSPDTSARQFAFVVPLSASTETKLARIRWSSGARSTEVSSNGYAGGSEVPTTVEGRVQVRSLAAHAMGVLLRDVQTGEILSIGRNSEAVAFTHSTSVDVIVSDGVHSRTRRVEIGRLSPDTLH
jgi:hypothetical protein